MGTKELPEATQGGRQELPSNRAGQDRSRSTRQASQVVVRIVGGPTYKQAYALAKAMGRRPTRQLASVFFQALKKMGLEAMKK